MLVVCHEASRSGAPLLLAGLLEWLHTSTDVSIHTLLLGAGPLRPRFEAVGTVSAVTDRPGTATLELLERGLVARGHLRARKAPAALRYVPSLMPLGRFDMVYLNSITTLDLLPHLRGRPRILAHIHEGPWTIRQWWQSYGPVSSRLRPDRWVAVNDESAAVLSCRPGVERDRVAIHHPFIDIADVRSPSPSTDDPMSLRAKLGIPPEAAIVVGSGTIDRRKGPDLFVQLANEVERRRSPGDRPVHFLWVGGDLAGPDWPLMRADIERSGATQVHVTGVLSDPRAHYQLADVFALTSREDPFPLVCLEHAALGVPVVAYSSSGIHTFLTAAGPDAADGIIDYLDVTGMAQRIRQLIASPSLSRVTGEQLRRCVEQSHDISTAAPVLAGELGLSITADGSRSSPS